MLGVHGRGKIFDPIQEDFGFNEIAAIDRDVVKFEASGFNWQMVFERNADFLGVTVELLDDVPHLKASGSFQLIQVGEKVLVEQYFNEEFHNGVNSIGSTKFLSWDELVKPSRGIVVDDMVFVRVKMDLWKDCMCNHD